MTNRFDYRSAQEFKKDIKNMHITEADIALRICLDLKNQCGKWPDIVPNGTDFKGDFKKQASLEADYIINNTHTEITHSSPLCKVNFHWKVPKVNFSIKNNVSLVFVNRHINRTRT